MRNLYPPPSSHGNAAAAAAAAQHARAAAAATYYSHTNNLSHHMSRYPQVGKYKELLTLFKTRAEWVWVVKQQHVIW